MAWWSDQLHLPMKSVDLDVIDNPNRHLILENKALGEIDLVAEQLLVSDID
ncbi:hypothetical protein J6590_085247 [Homalodisca vitripennis]|nr:hypothetical protein J6590_085247 [Homalodisca vitripennis]